MVKDRVFVYGTGTGRGKSYGEILEDVQRHLTVKFAKENLTQFIDGSSGRDVMTDRIARYLKSNHVGIPDGEESAVVDELYEDMAGISFLSKYLNDINACPDLEEININKWDSVVLHYSGGRVVFSGESFLSPQHALDVLRRILSRNNETIDDAVPAVTSSLTENIRITAFKYPLIPKDFGISASIRITRPQSISEDKLVNDGSINAEIIDFLSLCIRYSVSMLIAGRMGSGKTTFLNCLASKIPPQKRIMPIEEGSRELSLMRFDDSGRLKNQIIPTLARPDANSSEQNFDSSRILQFGLRFDVDYFLVQEIRNAVAYVAQEAARTGSAVYSTIHSNDAESTYPRLMTLMQLVSTQDEDTLMRLAVEAFPIVIYMRQLEDKTRRVMEVLEGEKYVRGKGLVSRSLFRFVVEDNVEQPDGKTRVIGHFEQASGISPRLRKLLLNNGAPRKLVDKYWKGE